MSDSPLTDYTQLLANWELPEAIMWLLADQPDLMGPTTDHIAARLGVELEEVNAAIDDLVKRGLVQFYPAWIPGAEADDNLYVSNTIEGSRYLRQLSIERQPRRA